MLIPGEMGHIFRYLTTATLLFCKLKSIVLRCYVHMDMSGNKFCCMSEQVMTESFVVIDQLTHENKTK